MSDRDALENGVAKCRGCGLVLKGKDYSLGGSAYHPRTGEQCPANHYGGFVCSEACDRRACIALESTMPGVSGTVGLPMSGARESIERNWRKR